MSAKEKRNYWRKGLEDNPMRRCVTARLLWRRVRREYLPSWILARRVTALALAVVFGFMSSVLALDLQEFVAETEHDGLVGAAAADQLHDGNNQDMTSAGEGRLRSAADYWYSISNDEVTITGYRGAGGDITIPGSIDEYPVTSIEDEAFSDCAVITSVTIPNSVTSIENYAFRECSSLTSVVIPDSVTRIGEGAFLRCSGLTSVVIPTSVTTIEMGAFCDCTGLTSVTIPNSVTIIGGQAFGSCSGLTSVEIPDSVTRIEFGAFSHCSGLTSVVIPDSVTSIEEMAFSDCSGLTSVVIPDSVISIRKYAFRGCSSLASVVIPNSVTSIENYAFFGCSSLTSVMIGDSVISIRESAFSGCSSLTSIYIWGTPPKVVLEGAFGSVPGTVYYIFGTAGWGAEFGGLPTAVWTSEVTFVGNGGTPSLSEQIYNAGVAYTELPTANRPDFNFTGWWTAAEEGSKVDTTTLVPLLTSGHTLYAQWEVPPGFFSVKFEWGVHGIRTGGG